MRVRLLRPIQLILHKLVHDWPPGICRVLASFGMNLFALKMRTSKLPGALFALAFIIILKESFYDMAIQSDGASDVLQLARRHVLQSLSKYQVGNRWQQYANVFLIKTK